MEVSLEEKKKEILQYTTWINLENITLSEVSQAETNTAWLHLYEVSNMVRLRGKK